jgi:hypothetical protein
MALTGRASPSYLYPSSTPYNHGFQSDVLALNLDYFTLHIRSINLLGNVHIRPDSNIRKYLCRSSSLRKEDQLLFFVGYLLLIASNSSKVAAAVDVAGPEASVKTTILVEVRNWAKG